METHHLFMELPAAGKKDRLCMLPRAKRYLVSRGCDISALHVQITIPYKNWLIKTFKCFEGFYPRPRQSHWHIVATSLGREMDQPLLF